MREKVSQSELCQFIDQHRELHEIKQLYRILSVPRSNYYQSNHQTESKWKYENIQLPECIKEVYFESKRRYGAIKVHRQLLKEGISVSLKRVQRLMKSVGLASIIQKKYTPYKQSLNHYLDNEPFKKGNVQSYTVIEFTPYHIYDKVKSWF